MSLLRALSALFLPPWALPARYEITYMELAERLRVRGGPFQRALLSAEAGSGRVRGGGVGPWGRLRGRMRPRASQAARYRRRATRLVRRWLRGARL